MARRHYVKYDIYFNLTLEEVYEIQREKLYNLQYDYKCIYSFVEETHKDEVEVAQYDKKRKIKVTFYSIIFLYSGVPLKKKHIVGALEQIPNVDIGEKWK